jgi:hypothetical protein
VRRTWPLLIVPLAATACFEGYFYFDWDSGVVRALLTCAVLGLLALARFGTWRPAPWPRPLRLALSALACVLLFWHFKEGLLSAMHERHSEMGDIHTRAVALLREGVTPWKFGTVLDEGSYRSLVLANEVVACRTSSPTPTPEAITALWSSSHSGSELLPENIDTPACQQARALLSLTGYKYGPVMLASYVPLVLLVGPGGVYLTHLLCLLGIIAALAVLLRRRAPEALVMACVVLLGQSVLRRDTLLDSDCDLIPTCLLLWALVAFEQQRDLGGGVLTGLTLAAKIFPGAFLLPLLLAGRKRRALLGCASASVLAWAPALAVDGRGVWDNVVRFNLDRGADSTSLVFYLPPAASLVLRLGAAALFTWAFVRLVLRKTEGERLAFIAFSMGLFFLSAKVFHNNYLVWWLPVAGATFGQELSALRAAPTA